MNVTYSLYVRVAFSACQMRRYTFIAIGDAFRVIRRLSPKGSCEENIYLQIISRIRYHPFDHVSILGTRETIVCTLAETSQLRLALVCTFFALWEDPPPHPHPQRRCAPPAGRFWCYKIHLKYMAVSLALRIRGESPEQTQS